MLFKEPRRALTYFEGKWHEGNPPLMGPFTHGAWMGQVAWDGARAFRRLAPDLDLHCARLVRSAQTLGLAPGATPEELTALAWDGIERFPPDAELYIRPIVYAEDGFIVPDAATTRWMMSVLDAPMPHDRRFTACLSSTRRPAPEMAVTDAKCAAQYTNIAREAREARARGFDTSVVLDPWDNVAEFATANLFLVKDGQVKTPKPNGSFLVGITRTRTIGLLRDAGIRVDEATIAFDELLAADEVFACGTFAKVVPIVRVESRDLQPGPLTARARALYFAWAETCGRRP
jgi:branched-chain amino acid aminotransferase